MLGFERPDSVAIWSRVEPLKPNCEKIFRPASKMTEWFFFWMRVSYFLIVIHPTENPSEQMIKSDHTKNCGIVGSSNSLTRARPLLALLLPVGKNI